MTMLTEFSVFQVMGLVGVLAFVAAVAAVQLGFVDARRPTFCSVTAVAAVAVLGSTVDDFNLHVALIGVLVLLVSLISLLRGLAARRNARRQVDRWVEQNWMSQHYSSR